MKFKKGHKYELKQVWKNYYDLVGDGHGNSCRGYHYAKPVSTGEYDICDCMIVNAQGKVHPGFKDSPVPVNAESLEAIAPKHR